MCLFCIRDKSQAIIEAAIVVPVLLLMFLGVIYFGTRLYVQNKTAMVVRYAAQYASVYIDKNSKASISQVESAVKKEISPLFPGGVKLDVNVDTKMPSGGVALVDEIIRLAGHLLSGWFGGHTYVKLTTYQATLPYAAPQPVDEESFHQEQKNYEMQGAMPVTDKWHDMWDLLKSLWRHYPHQH